MTKFTNVTNGFTWIAFALMLVLILSKLFKTELEIYLSKIDNIPRLLKRQRKPKFKNRNEI